jgi:hypothetical protein
MEKNNSPPLSPLLITPPKTLLKIKTILLTNRSFLKEKYSIKSLAIFGSYVRGDQTEKSDVDLLVEFEGTPGGFAFIYLANNLEQLLGAKVDLLTLRMIQHNPYLKKSIEEDLLPIF